MKPRAALEQLLSFNEYVWRRGLKSRDAALDAIDRDCADGEISLCEKPRAIRYLAADNRPVWAIALTDTSIPA